MPPISTLARNVPTLQRHCNGYAKSIGIATVTPKVRSQISVRFLFCGLGLGCLFLTHGCCFATSVSLCGYLSVGRGECGAVKQWKMTSVLCAHCLPANRTFQNRKSGRRTLSFFFNLANEAPQVGEMAKFACCPVCKNNCELLL